MDMNVYPKFGDKLFHLLFKHIEYDSLVFHFIKNKINADKLEILELNNVYNSPRLSKKSLINPKMTLSEIRNELKQLLLQNKLITIDDEQIMIMTKIVNTVDIDSDIRMQLQLMICYSKLKNII